MLLLFLSPALSLISSVLLTPMAIKAAWSLRIVDLPGTDVKTHATVTPYLGGLAIFMAVLLPLTVTLPLAGIHLHFKHAALLIGCLLMLVTGLTDDIRNIGPYTKMLMQFLAVYAVWIAGVQIHLTDNQAVNLAVTFVWIAGLTNAFNLIDIMDGLSAGVAAIGSLFLAVIFLESGETGVGCILLALSGACLGFLKYNFRPAQIFMGDAGSLFIGFILGCLTVQWLQNPAGNHFFIPLFILGVPLFELIFVSGLRIRAGRSPLKGSRDHFALRLVQAGFTVRKAVLLTYCFCIGAGCLALTSFYYEHSTPYAVLLMLVIYSGIAWKLGKMDMGDVPA